MFLLNFFQRLIGGTTDSGSSNFSCIQNTSVDISIDGKGSFEGDAATPPNFLLLTLDSCRYDVFTEANTPVLDEYSPALRAYTPANFTYPAHHAFFAGVFPQVIDDLPYFNRFNRQLIALQEIGARQVAKHALIKVKSNGNLITGLAEQGYQTVGAGAMDWFQQESLTSGFQQFSYTGTDAKQQIKFLRQNLLLDRPFFGFINFGETHAPFSFEGKKDKCPVDVRARIMNWPPEQEEVAIGRKSQAFSHQRRAVEFLDNLLPDLFDGLPGNTIVVLTADHGECFGEDGCWGHGIHHPMVFEVPLAVFRLDKKSF